MTRLLRGLGAALLALTLCLPVLAQEATAPSAPAPAQAAAAPGVPDTIRDETFAQITRRANAAIEADGVSVDALTSLRQDLLNWRNEFEAAANTTDVTVDAVRTQLAALGPAPAEGETEPADIAANRAQLEDRLETLLAPNRAAQAAFAQADALINRIDSLIEADRAQEILRKDPTPLNPVIWPAAAGAVGTWVANLARDLWVPFSSPTSRAVWLTRGFEIGILILVATVLLWRSGTWLARLRDRIATREGESAVVRVGLLLISLARLILPVIGLFAIVRIGQLIGASSIRVDAAQTLIPGMGLVVLLSRWLALQALPVRETASAFLPVTPARRPAARFYAVGLGFALAAAYAVEVIAPTSTDPTASRTVSHFVLIAISGVLIFRLGQLFLSEGRAAVEDETEGFWAQILRLLGRALIVVGVISPVIAAVGYVNLAGAILWPSVLSLALIMLIGILQGLVFDVYAAVTRRHDAGRDALTPTLVGFALALAAAPVFALIWGVRPETLGDWWASFLRGFDIGGTEISPANFMTFALVFVIGLMLVRLLKGVLRTNILPKTTLDTGGTNAILSGTGYIGITLAALIAITAAGIDLSGLAIVAGALSVGIGFGLQTIVQNFVSGIILLVERPIKLGDWVNVGGVEGFVRQISVRSTRIETFDRQDVIVPNADLISGVVTNYTLQNNSGRVVLTVGVAYGSDTRRVQAILQEVAEAHPMVILEPPPLVTFDGFGADSLNFTIRVVLRDILFKPIVGSELNHAIAARFQEEGLEIPFAQRDIWLRNPEALRAATPSEEP